MYHNMTALRLLSYLKLPTVYKVKHGLCGQFKVKASQEVQMKHWEDKAEQEIG